MQPHKGMHALTHIHMPFNTVLTWGVGKRHVKAREVDQCISSKEEHGDQRCNYVQVTWKEKKKLSNFNLMYRKGKMFM